MTKEMDVAASELNARLLGSQKAHTAFKRVNETKERADQGLCKALESVDVETVKSLILFKIGVLSMSEEVMGHLASIFLEIIKKIWPVDKCLALSEALSQAQKSEALDNEQENLLNSLVVKLKESKAD